MGGRGDWGIPASSLTLPPFAGPTDAAIIIGPDLPQCMQANYASAIFFRPTNTTAPQRTPIYFEAQRLNLLAPSTQTVDYGWLIDDGVNCGYVVYRRVASLNVGAAATGPLLIQDTWSDAIETVGGIVSNGIQVQWRGNTDVLLLSPAEFFAYGDQLSLRNDCDAGPGNAVANTVSNVYSDYPTGISNSITKVGPAGNTSLLVFLSVTFYVTVADTSSEFGVSIGGSDFMVCRFTTAVTAGVRLHCCGMAKIPGLAAGAYTVKPRWRRTAGTGQVSADLTDWVSLATSEVAV